MSERDDDIDRALTEVMELDERVEVVSEVLATLISWMAQSANSPIRRDEAEKLLARLREPH